MIFAGISADHDRVFAAAAVLLREICQRPALRVEPATWLADIEELDSLRIMETVALLEERFGVQVDTGALERLMSVDDIVQLVLSRLPAPPS